MKIKEVIVVEGKTDKQFLETFIEADFLIANGSAIDGFDKAYLQEIAKTRGVILFTDPDAPGEKIRKTISSYLESCKHAFVRKEFAISHHKVGVAEASKEEILRALSNVITLTSTTNQTLQANDLYELQLIGFNSRKKKEKIEQYFHIGHCNGKTLLKRLNMLNVNKEKIKEVLQGD